MSETNTTFPHMLRILRTELDGRLPTLERPIRILDAGCGDGKLMAYLTKGLAPHFPNISIELYGFDVVDHGVQREGYLANARAALGEKCPGVPWEARLQGISVTESWPYPDSTFDAIVSNQVLEHVGDHDKFFTEIKRTLQPGGFSVHLFPAAEEVFDFHLNLPLVHKIGDHDLRQAYIRALSRLGMGKYRSMRRTESLDSYVERHADYIQHLTNFRTTSYFLALAKAKGLRGSYRYTREFYTGRLTRRLLRREPPGCYRKRRSAVLEALAILLFRYVASVTLFLENRNTYNTR